MKITVEHNDGTVVEYKTTDESLYNIIVILNQAIEELYLYRSDVLLEMNRRLDHLSSKYPPIKPEE